MPFVIEDHGDDGPYSPEALERSVISWRIETKSHMFTIDFNPRPTDGCGADTDTSALAQLIRAHTTRRLDIDRCADEDFWASLDLVLTETHMRMSVRGDRITGACCFSTTDPELLNTMWNDLDASVGVLKERVRRELVRLEREHEHLAAAKPTGQYAHMTAEKLHRNRLAVASWTSLLRE